MKKIISILCALILCFPSTIFASSDTPNSEKTMLSDGYYIITEIEGSISNTRSASKTGTKTSYLYDDNDNLIASLTVGGVFSVNTGSSVSCTSASYSKNIYNTNWSATSCSSSKNNSSTTKASATAKMTLKNSSTNKSVSMSVTLYCDKNGNLS